jgi:hypothetical protein
MWTYVHGEPKSHPGFGRLRWSAFFAGLSIVLLLCVDAHAMSADGAGTRAFCNGRQFRDDEKLFKAMPNLHRLPSSGQVPFAPRRVEITPIGFRRILVGASKLGAFVAMPSGSHLMWKVDTQLSRVDQQGRPLGSTRRHQQRIGVSGGTAKQFSLGFDVGGMPSLYRFDITFRARSGRLLGHYSEYFRVMPRRVDVKLALSKHVYGPGATLLARLQNRGTTPIYFGYSFSIERWTGNEWVLDPSILQEWPLVELSLNGGAMDACQRVVLDGVPGRYRMSRKFSTSPAGRTVPVRAEFEIAE